MYLHSTAQTEDTVVSFLGPEALQGSLHHVVLLGEQVIGPASNARISPYTSIKPRVLLYMCSGLRVLGGAYRSPSCL